MGFLNKITKETYYTTDKFGEYWKKNAPAYFKLKQVKMATEYKETDQKSVQRENGEGMEHKTTKMKCYGSFGVTTPWY